MTTTEYLELTEKMRYAQNQYYHGSKTREEKTQWLLESKRLEREVDRVIAGWRKGQRTKSVQGQLFSTPPSAKTHA